MNKEQIFLQIDEIYSEHDGGEIYLSEERINQIKEIIEQAINHTRCCEELPTKEDDTEYWFDLVNWQSGGIEEVSNTNLIKFKKDIDIEIQRRLKK